MTEFTPPLVSECLRITDILIESPASSLFLDPVDPVRDNAPNYFQVVQFPQDLTSIRARLASGGYRFVAEWQRDMRLVWSNAQFYNGELSVFGRLAGFLERKFEKLSFGVCANSTCWLAKVDGLFTKLDRLLTESPPPRLDQHLAGKEFQHGVPAKEIQKLGKAVGALKSKSDSLQLIGLLITFEVPFTVRDGEVRVTTNGIAQFAAKPLMAFVKEKHQAMGLAYPR
jgi:hypothetical protein